MKQTYKPGDIICRENTFESWMYEIVSGCVVVIKNYGEETEQKLAELRNGFFGEMGMIDSLPRTATIIAKEETVVNVLDEDALHLFLEENPEKMNELLICLVNRLSNLNEEYLEACNTIKTYLETEKKEKSILTKMKRFANVFRVR